MGSETAKLSLGPPESAIRFSGRAFVKRDSYRCFFCGGRWGSFEALDSHTRVQHQGEGLRP